ncbi:MAG TPA: DUF5317 domain-containing protein [Candidatus Acidoferrales bacterium]|nr:DUF5317 domain-containing protein [Candidatus Acidoferrales bacterium]
MLIVLGGLLGVGLGFAAGGSLQRLASIRLRWPWVVLVALLVKEVGLFGPLARWDYTPLLYVASLVLLIAWTVYHRDVLPGIPLVSLGLLMNVVVMAANGGRMPVSPDLLSNAPPALIEQLHRTGHVGQYVLMTASTRLGFLGDIVAYPDPVSRIFPQAYSAGDLVSLLGMLVVGYFSVRTKPLATPPPGSAPSPR